MLSDQRQYEITQIIYNEGKANISELAERFHVTSETIRRDLNTITANEKIKKVHGGAISTKRPLREDSYEKRKTKNYEAKRQIGIHAATFVCDNDIIAIDSGTDTESLANAIFNVSNIKVLTNSMPIAGILSKKQRHGDFTGEIILLGGEINPENESAYGMLTNKILNSFTLDKAFVGATAVSPAGVMSWNASEGIFTATMIERAERVYLLAESDKFDKNSFYCICPLKSLDGIITDDENEISDRMKQLCVVSKTKLQIVKMKEDV